MQAFLRYKEVEFPPWPGPACPARIQVMRRALASLVLSALFVLVGSGFVQEKVRFERRLHLAGWEEIELSSFSDLYDLKTFEAEEGKQLDAAGLKKVQAAWLAERERVATLLETEHAEPRRWALFLLERRLKQHDFFSKIECTRLDDVDGFVVYVQAPKKADPAYAKRVAREQVARILPLRGHFQKTYVEPGGLTRRDDCGAEVLFVLASLGDLKTYARLSFAGEHYRSESYYDPKLRAAVLFEEPFESSITEADKTRAARHAYAHLLLHAYETGTSAPVQQDWLHEGLASYLAELAAGPDGKLSAPEMPVETLRRLLAATQSPETVLSHFRRISDLLVMPTYQHIDSRAELEGSKAGIPSHRIDYGEIRVCYWRESLLLVDFLQRGERAAAFQRYLAAELAGSGGAAGFHRAFPGRDPSEIERAFLDFLFGEHRRLLPSVALNGAAIEAILQRDAALLGPAEVAEGAGDAAQPSAGSARIVDAAPADLAPNHLAPEAALALALDLARRGRSGGAEEGLSALLAAGSLEPEMAARIERERDRLAAWNRLRAAWFAGLSASGKTYKVEFEDKAVRVKVKGVEGAKVLLEENRAGRTELDLEALDPAELAQEMGREAEALPDGWARAVPLALTGDAHKVARGLDAADPAQEAFATDIEADYEALLARGQPLGELLLFSREPEPKDPASAQALVDRLGAVAKGRAACPEIEPLLPLLRGCARKLFGVVFEQKGITQLAHGRWETLPDKRVRLSYAFDDAAELQDFQRADDYLSERRPTFGELHGTVDKLELKNSGLAGLGRSVLVHDLGFAAPLTVRYTLTFDKAEKGTKAEIWYCNVGICDDGHGHYAAALNHVHLEVIEPGEPKTAYDEVGKPIAFGKSYVIELAHDGKSVKQSLDGAVQHELETDLKTGRVFLLFHTDRVINIKDLVIEGTLDERYVALARQRWCDERIAELGL